MRRPCPILIDCLGIGTPDPDWPVLNLSAEAPDPLIFWRINYPDYDPYDNNCLFNCNNLPEQVTCADILTSTESAEMVAILAAAAGITCANPNPNPGDCEFFNDEQTATVTCFDGSTSSFTVPAGAMRSGLISCTLGTAWVGMANAWAMAYAQQQASALLECEVRIISDVPQGPGAGTDPPAHPPGHVPGSPRISDNPGWCCIGETLDPALNTYSIAGGSATTGFTFEISAGSLPPGTALIQLSPRSAEVAGTPITPGQHNYTIRATSTSLPTRVVEVSDVFYVMGITNPDLPNAQGSTLYSETLAATGGTAPFTFATTDPLPNGLTLYPNGLLEGVPTVTGDFAFDVSVTDADGGVCTQEVSLTIVSPASYKICRWTTEVQPVLGVVIPGPCSLSVDPAWDGVFNAAGTFSETGVPDGPIFFFNNRSLTIGGFTYDISASGAPDWPATHWNLDTNAFTNLHYDGSSGFWILTIRCAGVPGGTSIMWAGSMAGAPGDAAGVYNRILGVPLTITVEPTSGCCCQEDVATPPKAYQGSPYYHVLALPTFGTGPYTFNAPGLPAGLAINQITTLGGTTAAISGTPTTLGSHSVLIEITDSLGAMSCCQVTMDVIASDWLDAIVWTADPLNHDTVTYNLDGAFGWFRNRDSGSTHGGTIFDGAGNNTSGLVKNVRVTIYMVVGYMSAAITSFDSPTGINWPTFLIQANWAVPVATHDYAVSPGAFNIRWTSSESFAGYDYQCYMTMEIL